MSQEADLERYSKDEFEELFFGFSSTFFYENCKDLP